MDSNDKILLSGSNVSLDLSQNVINLRVSSYLCELRGACSYILGFPRFGAKLHQTCGAFVTICLRLTLGKFTHCRPILLSRPTFLLLFVQEKSLPTR